VKLLPTPTSRDYKGSADGFNARRDGGLDLPGAIKLLPTPRTTDANGAGLHGTGGMDLRTTLTTQDFAKYAEAVERWEESTQTTAPLPTEPSTACKSGWRYNVRFGEWMMGWPKGWVTDLITTNRSSKFRDDAGFITNTAAVRMVGNGVVPQQAAQAISDLLNGWDD
jgi:hypothetical protein